jgi:hypothetical protein
MGSCAICHKEGCTKTTHCSAPGCGDHHDKPRNEECQRVQKGKKRDDSDQESESESVHERDGPSTGAKGKNVKVRGTCNCIILTQFLYLALRYMR